jgi:plasmid stabilization system protein ParE
VDYRVSIGAEAENDLVLIFDFLVESHVGFGDPIDTSFKRAAQRIAAIRRDAARLSRAPHRGTLEISLGPNRRHVNINRAVFYFEINETAKEVRILAVFFGGQDHQRRMLERLL